MRHTDAHVSLLILKRYSVVPISGIISISPVAMLIFGISASHDAICSAICPHSERCTKPTQNHRAHDDAVRHTHENSIAIACNAALSADIDGVRGNRLRRGHLNGVCQFGRVRVFDSATNTHASACVLRHPSCKITEYVLSCGASTISHSRARTVEASIYAVLTRGIASLSIMAGGSSANRHRARYRPA